MDIDIDWLERLLQNKHQNVSPAKLVNYDSGRAAPKGNNYGSNVLRIRMKMMLASGAAKTISVIVKQAEKRNIGGISYMAVHKTEVRVYGTIFPLMEALMDEYEDKRDTLWAKFYGFSPYYDLTAFEDLKSQNYELIDRTKWQNEDHAILVLRNIARLHAMSKVLLDRKLIDSNDAATSFMSEDTEIQHCLLRGPLKLLSQAMIKQAGSWTSDWVEFGERIEKQIPTICTKLHELALNGEKKFEVLNHGDLWSSNMMFKRLEYTEMPIAVKFVDLESTHLNSFMWDVVHYMFSSIRPPVRRASKELLLKAYHESLSKNLKFFNCQSHIPTLEDVETEFTRLTPLAFIVLTTILPMSSASSAEAFSLSKLFTHPPEDAFDESIFYEEKFVKAIGDDLLYFRDHNII